MAAPHADTTTLTGHTDPGTARRWSPLKIALWAAPALLMLSMLIRNQVTTEEGWSAGDFAVATVVLYGALGAFEAVARTAGTAAFRAGFGVGIAALVMLVWGNAAVGITDTDADGWYLGVLAVGIGGPALVRLRARGMARGMAHAMFATALAMAVVSGIALAAGKIGPNNSALQITGLTVFYAALFAGSGMLFRTAAREQARQAGS